MITEIVEGPYSINNIDLYSNYSGNNIVSLNLSFLVLTCKAILWQKSNLSNHKESCSVFIMNLHHCLNLRFTFLFASSYSVFQLGNEPVSLQLRLGFSSQRTSLHCTIIEATLYTTSGQEMRVCLSTQKYRCVCQVIPQLFNFTFLHQMFLLSLFQLFWYGRTVKFVRDTIFLRPLPKSPPIHRMLIPPFSAKIRGFKIKPCDVPIFPSLRICKNSAQGLVPLYV